MSKPNYSTLANSDTWAGFLEKFDTVLLDMRDFVVTTADVAQPNTTNSGQTSGNAHVEGILSADTLVAVSEIRGGTVSTPGDLSVNSNVDFSGNTSTFSGNVSIEGTALDVTSNVSVDSTQIQANTETFELTSTNTSITSENYSVNVDTEFAITGTGDLVVDTDATFNADVIIGSNASDSLEIRATITEDILSTANAQFNNILSEGVEANTGNITNLETTDATVTNDLTVEGNVSTNGSLDVAGNTDIVGDIQVSGNSTVDNANVVNDMNVGGDVFIEGNVTIVGTATFSSNIELSLSESTINDLTVNDTMDLTNAGVIGDIIPNANTTYNVGNTEFRYANVYAEQFIGALDWSNVTSKPDPRINLSLTGFVVGTANTTLTNLANGSITLNTTLGSGTLTLGTDTEGNYVETVSAGGGISVSGADGEGSTKTVSHSDTSSVSNVSVDNSAGTVLQDLVLSFDTYGHVTNASTVSYNLDNRYPLDSIKTIAIASSNNITVSGRTATINIVSGNNITAQGFSSNNTIRFNSTDTLNSVMTRGNSTALTANVGGINVAGVADVGGELVVDGDVTLNGGANYIGGSLEVADNLVVLNADHSGTPTQDVGFTVNRGSLSDKTFAWDESGDAFSTFDASLALGNGNLTANLVNANLNGNVTGSLTGNVTGTVSSIANHDTGDLSEGTNLYYTVARANTAISNRVTKSFVENLGIDISSLSGTFFENSLDVGNGTIDDRGIAIGHQNNINSSYIGRRDTSGIDLNNRILFNFVDDSITFRSEGDINLDSNTTVSGDLTVTGDIIGLPDPVIEVITEGTLPSGGLNYDIPAGYSKIVIELDDVYTNSSSVHLIFAASTNGGSTFIELSSTYDSSGDSIISQCRNIRATSGKIELFNPGGSGFFTGSSTFLSYDAALTPVSPLVSANGPYISGGFTSSSAVSVNRIRIIPSAGTIIGGTYKIYGYLE